MALDTIIMNGDQAMFIPLFGSAIVSVQPGVIEGSGLTTIKGKNICIKGDESSVEVANCSYIAPPFVVAGMGTLKIQQLGPDQLTANVTSDGGEMILQGTMFNAVFEVSSPAKQTPPTNAPDPMKQHLGKGKFVPANVKIKAD